ncbi:MAG: hypothetical protein V4665_01830 [Patescibacteria group bacterium]
MTRDKNQFTRIFQEAKARYKELEHTDIELTFTKSLFFTMQASVKLASLFHRKRKYTVNVNLKRVDLFSMLSDNDILAWFGHELAHIVDYETMSRSKFLIFSLRYLVDLTFRFSVERRITVFACNNEFAEELLGAWKKFRTIDTIGKGYKNYIIKNYSPRWEDIKNAAERDGITEEAYRSFTRA